MPSTTSDDEKPKVASRRRHLRPGRGGETDRCGLGSGGRYPDRDRLLAASRLSAWGLRASEAVMTSAKVARHLSTVWTNITPALSDTTHLENSL